MELTLAGRELSTQEALKWGIVIRAAPRRTTTTSS